MRAARGPGPQAALSGTAPGFVQQAATLEEQVLDRVGKGSAGSGIARHELELPAFPGQEGVDRLRAREILDGGGDDLALPEAKDRNPFTTAGVVGSAGGEDPGEPTQVADLQHARRAESLDQPLEGPGGRPRSHLLARGHPEVRVAGQEELDADEQLPDGSLLRQEVVGPKLHRAVTLPVAVRAGDEDEGAAA